MKETQLLFIEDLGVSQGLIAKLALSMDMPFELMWDPELADTDRVEVIVTVKKKVDAELLKKFHRVKVVAVAFTGYDTVDLRFCKEHDIAVYNVPVYSTKSVSELTLGLAIGLLRQIPQAYQMLKTGGWEGGPGIELSGKTVGILGTGTIGMNTARLFKAFGCEIVGWSRTEKEEFRQLGGTYLTQLEDFFEVSDIVTLNVPLNDKTRGMIGREAFKAMKKTAYLINTARGPIVQEDDLIRALQEGEIAGAGIDVFDQEPLPKDHSLLALDKVILTPHIAYKTEEALNRRARTTLENIRNYYQNDSTNRVA